jgi:hypothetical protein
MGAPVLIPAAIGAVGSAAMGKSPITGALMGGALGGFGSAAGLFGSGAAGAGAGATGATSAGGTGLFGAAEAISPFTPTGVLGAQTMTPGLTGSITGLGVSAPAMAAQNAPMFAGPSGMFDVAGTQNQILGGIGQQTAMGGGGFDPSFMGSVQRGLESGYGTLSDWAKANPMQALSTTGQVVQAVSPQEQQQQVGQPAIPPVTRGTYNTAPTLGQGQNEKVATRMQVTPNQLNLYPSFYRGGF